MPNMPLKKKEEPLKHPQKFGFTCLKNQMFFWFFGLRVVPHKGGLRWNHQISSWFSKSGLRSSDDPAERNVWRFLLLTGFLHKNPRSKSPESSMGDLEVYQKTLRTKEWALLTSYVLELTGTRDLRRSLGRADRGHVDPLVTSYHDLCCSAIHSWSFHFGVLVIAPWYQDPASFFEVPLASSPVFFCDLFFWGGEKCLESEEKPARQAVVTVDRVDYALQANELQPTFPPVIEVSSGFPPAPGECLWKHERDAKRSPEPLLVLGKWGGVPLGVYVHSWG